MTELLSSRGTSECRVCGGRELVSVLDLGAQPLPSEYGLTAEELLDIFPLHMRICPCCGLGQLGEYVLPERIFHDAYPYLSSASSTWVEHARKYATSMKEALGLDSQSLLAMSRASRVKRAYQRSLNSLVPRPLKKFLLPTGIPVSSWRIMSLHIFRTCTISSRVCQS